MSVRITTGGLYYNYRSNLHKSMDKFNKTMTQVETGRVFSTYAEDPSAASRSFQLRRTYWRTGDQIDNSNYLISKYSTAWDALDAIVDGTSETPGLDGIREALTAVNGTAGSTRQTLGVTLWNISESIVKVMNTRYGDEFVFAGADGMRVPFQWDSNNHLTYRGFSVDAGRPVTEEQFSRWKADGELNSDNIPDYRQFVQDTYGVTIWSPGVLDEQNGVTEPPEGQLKDFQNASFEDYRNWYTNRYAVDVPNSLNTAEQISAAYERAGTPVTEAEYNALAAVHNMDSSVTETYRQYLDSLASAGGDAAEAAEGEEAAAEVSPYDSFKSWYVNRDREEDSLLTDPAAIDNAYAQAGSPVSEEDFHNLQTVQGLIDGQASTLKEGNADNTVLQDYDRFMENLPMQAVRDSSYADFQKWYVNRDRDPGSQLTDPDEIEAAYLEKGSPFPEVIFQDLKNEVLAGIPFTDREESDRELFAEFARDTREAAVSNVSYSDFQKWYGNEYAYESSYGRAGRRFDESTYEDIGIGMRADENGYTVPETAFNSVISGLEVMNYGYEEVEVVYGVFQDQSTTVRVSNNMVGVMRQLAQLFLDCNEFTGEFKSEEDAAVADMLTGRLQAAMTHMQEQHVEMDGKVEYLRKNLDTLTNTKDRLDKQIVDLEDLDPADGITSMTWAQFCYSAALRVGQQVMGETLLDYLR